MQLSDYINRVNQLYQTGISTEHSFRGILDELLRSIDTSILVTNEPKKIECGAPDYLISRKQIPIGYIEAKDLFDADLDGLKKTGNKEQFDRYKDSLDNIVFTDYLSFHFYRGHDKITSITIAEKQGKKIVPIQSQFDPFIRQMEDFMSYIGITIKNPKKLSQMMAGKARLLCDIINNALDEDEKAGVHTDLMEQFNSFKKILIHDITNKSFADVYAQTIVYGMFAARLHDPTLPTFSRQEAAELIPKSNPFLRKLFGYIAGPDLDDRIKWIVDDLVQIFLSCNVEEILHTYGKSTKMEDPIIHFYETFLAEYDPKLRKARGVWYTPAPVVNFIVRAVDDILKTEFGLSQGLADTSKTTITVNENGKEIKKDVHRVQILDPAAGTGTFLVETIKQIHKKFEGQQGIWNEYVDSHLIPRLNGFELLMASYAMAHLKIDLLLKETGYTPKTNQRLRVFLTNSLEEPQTETDTLFSNWLTTEANEANKIKNETPVMCVIGNPPYAVSSTNKGDWIQSLIAEYKKNLNEKKLNLDDDYIKFIRYGQYMIDKNGSGILAFISNNSFLDGITHRQMRKSLLESFDKIYIVDLHGNAKKKETSPDGKIDQNVFDIMQGVSINIFIKKDICSNTIGILNHYHLYGNRESKYEFLHKYNFFDVGWSKINTVEPYRFFVPKDFDLRSKYEESILVSELFAKCNSGVESGKDDFIIKHDINELISLRKDVILLESNELAIKYNINIDKASQVKNDISNSQNTCIHYRPFDIRYTFLSPFSEGVFWRPRHSIMKHFFFKNLGLIAKRGFDENKSSPIFISANIIDRRCWTRPGMQGAESIFPLYIYLDNKDNQIYSKNPIRTPNLNPAIVKQIAEGLGLEFTNEPIEFSIGQEKTTFAPIDLLDYIYAVLHSPAYREKYKEFLKIDFPRVPYPKDADSFWKLVEKGKAIRELHLLESPLLEHRLTQYPIAGTNQVGKIRYEDGKVYINESQYFSNVPQIAWDFYIGGYQPAQKWLKDRKDRTLNFEDINHYQHIIIALTETSRLMKEIDDLGMDW
ncbi:MAG: type ISP restriction/modification enzyme [Ignavibacteria bacterium]|jgi:predicted helicase